MRRWVCFGLAVVASACAVTYDGEIRPAEQRRIRHYLTGKRHGSEGKVRPAPQGRGAPSAVACENRATPLERLGCLAFYYEGFTAADHRVPRRSPETSAASDDASGCATFRPTSCASCHRPDANFSDDRPLGIGASCYELGRRTPSLYQAFHRDFLFWDGRIDSLWAQALLPFEQVDEMASNRIRVLRAVASEPRLLAAYNAAFPNQPLPTIAAHVRDGLPCSADVIVSADPEAVTAVPSDGAIPVRQRQEDIQQQIDESIQSESPGQGIEDVRRRRDDLEDLVDAPRVTATSSHPEGDGSSIDGAPMDDSSVDDSTAPAGDAVVGPTGDAQSTTAAPMGVEASSAPSGSGASTTTTSATTVASAPTTAAAPHAAVGARPSAAAPGETNRASAASSNPLVTPVPKAWCDAWEGLPEGDRRAITQAFVNVGIAIEAYEVQLRSENSNFDRALARWRSAKWNDRSGVADEVLSEDARRGLEVFIGKGNCVYCHQGPDFSDDKFHYLGILDLESDGVARQSSSMWLEGAFKLYTSPFNCNHAKQWGARCTGSGKLNGPLSVETLISIGQAFVAGQVRTPSLRNVAENVAFMHNGSKIGTLQTIDLYAHVLSVRRPVVVLDRSLKARLPGHPKATKIKAFRPIHKRGDRRARNIELTETNIRHLAAFLEALTGEPIDVTWRTDPWKPSTPTPTAAAPRAKPHAPR